MAERRCASAQRASTTTAAARGIGALVGAGAGHGAGGAGSDARKGWRSPRSQARRDAARPAPRDMGGVEGCARSARTPEARVVTQTTSRATYEMQRVLEAGGARRTCSRPCCRRAAGRDPPGRTLASKRIRRAAAQAAAPGRRGADAARDRGAPAVAEGNRTEEIADDLFISEETVVHVKHVMEKLGASIRTEAVAIALKRGIIQPSTPSCQRGAARSRVPREGQRALSSSRGIRRGARAREPFRATAFAIQPERGGSSPQRRLPAFPNGAAGLGCCCSARRRRGWRSARMAWAVHRLGGRRFLGQRGRRARDGGRARAATGHAHTGGRGLAVGAGLARPSPPGWWWRWDARTARRWRCWS